MRSARCFSTSATADCFVARGAWPDSLPVFRRDTLLVRPVVLKERDAYGRTVHAVGLNPISTIAMRGFLDQAARFEKFDSRAKALVHCKPPADIAELILARAGHWPFWSSRSRLIRLLRPCTTGIRGEFCPSLEG